jgi:hypothetical protein
MRTYVAEIEGRAVIAFRAKSAEEAQFWIGSAKAVRADLAVLEDEGRPLWDGQTEIRVRAANYAEQAAWRRKSVEMTEEDGEHNPNDTLLFFLAVSDPTDENVEENGARKLLHELVEKHPNASDDEIIRLFREVAKEEADAIREMLEIRHKRGGRKHS